MERKNNNRMKMVNNENKTKKITIGNTKEVLIMKEGEELKEEGRNNGL